MIAGTHIAFACAIGACVSDSTAAMSLIVFGSLLPDLDHPLSTVGRIARFISVPLHRRFGHRRHIHGFPLWGAVTMAGFAWWPLWWIGLGALSHAFIDCLNTSGVPALLPFSQKVCVLFTRKWRFACGSRTELGLMAVLVLFAYGALHVGNVGGIRALAGRLTGSPKMAYQQYREMGLAICHFEGTLRFRAGAIERGRWLVVGEEEKHGIAIWDEERERIIRIPIEAEFLRMTLVKGRERWQTVAVGGFARSRREAFFFDGVKWRRADPGGVVFGTVIGRRLAVEGVGR